MHYTGGGIVSPHIQLGWPHQHSIRKNTTHHTTPHMTSDGKITKEDMERIRLLKKVSASRHGFNQLTLSELRRLQELVEKKDYGKGRKTARSKKKLLVNINARIYELEEGRSIWGA